MGTAVAERYEDDEGHGISPQELERWLQKINDHANGDIVSEYDTAEVEEGRSTGGLEVAVQGVGRYIERRGVSYISPRALMGGRVAAKRVLPPMIYGTSYTANMPPADSLG